MCLDVCGLAANLYRRNTPVIKVQAPPDFALLGTQADSRMGFP